MAVSISQESIFARHKVIRAAQSVLASKKVSGTRMRLIAKSTCISQGTLHYSFPSKTGLLLAVMDEMQKYFELPQKQLLANGPGTLPALEHRRHPGNNWRYARR